MIFSGKPVATFPDLAVRAQRTRACEQREQRGHWRKRACASGVIAAQ
jgi:hypothetical protein